MPVIHKENGNGWLFLSTPLFIVIPTEYAIV